MSNNRSSYMDFSAWFYNYVEQFLPNHSTRVDLDEYVIATRRACEKYEQQLNDKYGNLSSDSPASSASYDAREALLALVEGELDRIQQRVRRLDNYCTAPHVMLSHYPKTFCADISRMASTIARELRDREKDLIVLRGMLIPTEQIDLTEERLERALPLDELFQFCAAYAGHVSVGKHLTNANKQMSEVTFDVTLESMGTFSFTFIGDADWKTVRVFRSNGGQ